MAMSRGKVYDVTEARARGRDPKDFWGQVGRSIRGKSVDETQITLLVDAVVNGLRLAEADVLLDLCCGNGALTDRLFERCQGGVGVDFSDYLIAIAKQNFERPPERTYVDDDVLHYARSAADPERFTKAQCYGSFATLSQHTATELLTVLRARFDALRKFFIGNIPDRALLHKFFDPAAYVPGVEDDPTSPVGLWWSVEQLERLAADTGWHVEIRRMPARYYASHYRFDAVLMPAR